MELLICRVDSLSVSERMLGTCESSEISRQASEFLQRCSCSRPPDPKMADNCSRWAIPDLKITEYLIMIPMMRMMPRF